MPEKLAARGIAVASVRSATLTRPDLEIRPRNLSPAQIAEILEALAAASSGLIHREKLSPKFEIALRLKSGEAYLVIAESGSGYIQQEDQPKLRFQAPELLDALEQILGHLRPRNTDRQVDPGTTNP